MPIPLNEIFLIQFSIHNWCECESVEHLSKIHCHKLILNTFNYCSSKICSFSDLLPSVKKAIRSKHSLSNVQPIDTLYSVSNSHIHSNISLLLYWNAKKKFSECPPHLSPSPLNVTLSMRRISGKLEELDGLSSYAFQNSFFLFYFSVEWKLWLRPNTFCQMFSV